MTILFLITGTLAVVAAAAVLLLLVSYPCRQKKEEKPQTVLHNRPVGLDFSAARQAVLNNGISSLGSVKIHLLLTFYNDADASASDRQTGTGMARACPAMRSPQKTNAPDVSRRQPHLFKNILFSGLGRMPEGRK